MEISQLEKIMPWARAARGLAYSSSLPALEALVNDFAARRRSRSILVTHLLHTAIEYIEQINSTFPVDYVIGIPYSSDEEAIASLRQKGYTVIVPESVDDTFRKAEEITLRALEESSESLVVQEVGGYLSNVTEKLSKYSHFLGIVEDTNNGHWRYENTSPHKVPILSMAQSPLKDVEDTVIGDAVVFSVERVLREEFSAMFQGSRCGVIGFGKIGTSCAIAIKGREAVVSIYDINPSKNMRAKVEGFFPLPLNELLSKSEIIIGATGRTSIRLEDMEFIKDGAILASASSKNIEFALDDFGSKCEIEVINDVVDRYTTPNGKHFFIINKGLPINFRDKSIIGTLLDMIYSELFVCMREIVEGKIQPGLNHSGSHIQNEVAKEWMNARSTVFRNSPSDKIWNYPNSLTE